jgi:hypothetical protein
LADFSTTAPCAAFVDDDRVVAEERQNRFDITVLVGLEVARHDVRCRFGRGLVWHGRQIRESTISIKRAVAAGVSAWEIAQGLEPLDWGTIGRIKRAESDG